MSHTAKLNSENVVSWLQNDEQGQLVKTALFYDSNGNLIQEFKAFPLTKVNDPCLSMSYKYSAGNIFLGTTATMAIWTQTMEDQAINEITDILLSSSTGTPGDPDGTKIADITTIGGIVPYVYILTSDPGNNFRIENGNELVWNGTAPSGSFPITIQVEDSIGQIFSKNFTIDAFAFANTLSVSFNGSDESLDLGTAASVQFNKNNSFSYSCWFYRDNGSGTRYIYSTNTGGDNGQGIGINTDGSERINFRLNGGTAGDRIHARTPTATYALSTWYHLVCTYDGSADISGVNIYVNGVSQTLTTVSNTLSGDFAVTNDSRIGARSDEASYYSGNIDEFSIHNIELSSAQVTTIYNAGVPIDLTGFAGIIHWYRMGDNDTFGFVKDVINALDAAMINMAPSNFDTNIP